MNHFYLKRQKISQFLSIMILSYISISAHNFTNGWTGNDVIPLDTLLSVAKWNTGVSNSSNGDSCRVSSTADTLNIRWRFGEGKRYKYAQAYIVLNHSIPLNNKDIFGFNFRGTHCSPEVRFMMKFEDNQNPRRAVTMLWEGLPAVERWCERISVLKKQFSWASDFKWDSVQIISFEVNQEPSNSQNIDSGLISIHQLICASVTTWQRSSILDTLAISSVRDSIARKAIQAIISRQTATGLLCTWKKDSLSYLYGQGLALKALSLDGVWNNGIPVNPSAQAAQKLASFLKNNQNVNGYWPRTWHSISGRVVRNLEDDSTVWEGDNPFIINGMHFYMCQSGDSSVATSLQKGSTFLHSLIDNNGKAYTYDFKNNVRKEITSCEAYAAIIGALNEIRDTISAGKVLDYIESRAWDDELKYFREGPDNSRTVLFANTWLSKLITDKGDVQKACSALSFVGKVLYTRGPDQPYGFDGIGPVATWYEGTLSYIVAGGPNSQTLYNTLINYCYPDGSIPHYNDSIAGAGVWAVKWSSLDGTSWLYYASKGYSPFQVISIPPKPTHCLPGGNSKNDNNTCLLSFNLFCNSKTGNVSFAVPKRSGFSKVPVCIRLYDLQGKLLKTIIDKKVSPGFYTVATDMQGKRAKTFVILIMESTGYRNAVPVLLN
jgi:hypothetical protein